MHQDRLAERPVWSEPVSNPNSLLLGKNTGIFRYSGANGTNVDFDEEISLSPIGHLYRRRRAK